MTSWMRTRRYFSEVRQQEPAAANLSERAQKVFTMVDGLCELRMGRAEMTTAEGEPLVLGEALTANEIVDCIKRLERSVQRWNKSGGRQGYVKFVAQFFP